MSHTPEPWTAHVINRAVEEHQIHDIRRIAACVNGCAGLNPAAYRELYDAAFLYVKTSPDVVDVPLFGISARERLTQALAHAQAQP